MQTNKLNRRLIPHLGEFYTPLRDEIHFL